MDEPFNEPVEPIVPSPLGPGDDDPRSPARGVAAAPGPPPGPGDGDADECDVLAPRPPGPGDVAFGPRQVTRMPKPTPASPVAPVVDDVSIKE